MLPRTNSDRPSFGVYATRKNAKDAIHDALEAEKLGFDCYWFTDHIIDDNVHVPHSELWTVLGAVGAVTKNIHLASGVTDTFRRSPAVTAQACATLHEMTDGRAILGIGAGERMNLIPFGIKYNEPVCSLVESINVIRLLWSSSCDNPKSFEGRNFSLKDAFLQTPLTHGQPQIFVGALGKKTREIAGRLGDGWIPWLNSPQTFKKRLWDLARGASTSGRDIARIEKIATLDIAISDDRETAREAILPSVKASLTCERSTLLEMGFDRKIGEDVSVQRGIFSTTTFDRVQQISLEIPDKYAEQVCAFGSADDCISTLEKFISSGATSFLFAISGSNYEFTIQKITKFIIPYFDKTSK